MVFAGSSNPAQPPQSTMPPPTQPLSQLERDMQAAARHYNMPVNPAYVRQTWQPQQ